MSPLPLNNVGLIARTVYSTLNQFNSDCLTKKYCLASYSKVNEDDLFESFYLLII